MEDLSTWKPRPAPAPVTLKGRFVTVEPYERARDAEALWAALGGLGTNERLRYFAAPDFADANAFADWLARVQQGGWLTEIFRDNETGKVVGMAHYMRADPANGVVEVGGVGHGLAMARSPLSTEVHYLMARHVFDDLGYRRYEWKCDNANEASKVTARRLGFTFEGVFRKHMLSRGKNRDTAWFAIINDDWPRLRAAFEAWLDPANFNADGSQKRRLENIRNAIPQ
jgi:RimJ/RimL family protein N-acetyltransferase